MQSMFKGIMKMKPRYQRVLLKLSGEGLAGENKTGIDADLVQNLAADVAHIVRLGVRVCLVVGGGNFFRGAKNAAAYMDRSQADNVGMLATVMNAVVLKSALDAVGCEAEIFSGQPVPEICQTYNFEKAISAVKERVVIFAGGTGCSYFTTDTVSVLRALEMHCDIMLKATQVDGVYDCDPRYNNEAKRYDEISYDEVIAQKLMVMDMTAVALARENHLPIMVFNQKEKDAVLKAVCGKIKCTIIK